MDSTARKQSNEHPSSSPTKTSASLLEFLHQGNKTTYVIAQILKSGLDSGQLSYADERTNGLLQAITRNPVDVYSNIAKHVSGNNDDNKKFISSGTCPEPVASSVHSPGIADDHNEVQVDTSACHLLPGYAEDKNVNRGNGRSISERDMSSCYQSSESSAALSTITDACSHQRKNDSLSSTDVNMNNKRTNKETCPSEDRLKRTRVPSMFSRSDTKECILSSTEEIHQYVVGKARQNDNLISISRAMEEKKQSKYLQQLTCIVHFTFK